MGFFSKQPASYLGVDIGASAIKLVEFRNDKRRARLSTYGFSEDGTFDSSTSATTPFDPERTAATLRDIMARAKVESRRAVAGLPTPAVFSSVITLPRMPEKELGDAVRWEAKKLVPLPIEEMVIDWKLLTPAAELTAKGTTGVARVFLTGAPRTLVERYLATFKAAGLELISLETEAFALIRSLVGNDPSTIILLDLGAVRSSITIVDQGAPVFSRSIDVGGRHVTAAIAEATGSDSAAAEAMKLDLAVLPAGNAATAALPQILPSTFASVVHEVRYAANLFRSQEEHRGRTIEKVILAGGTALLPTIADVLAAALELRVFVGDPWARVIYPVDLRSALDAIGPRFAVAVGLAMREIA